MAYNYEGIPEDDAARIRRHKERIDRRDVHRRRSWFGDGYDLFRVREIIAKTRFEAWVTEETHFSIRTAYNLADAAKMLFDAAGSAKFADLAPIKPSVAYLLAAPGTPKAVRDRFLPRLIEGVEVTLKEVRAALPPRPEKSKPAPEAGTEPTPMREPSPAVVSLARGLRIPERRLIRQLAQAGQLDMLVRALDWIDNAPSKVSAETDDRLAEHVADALAHTPPAMPDFTDADDDDDEDPPPSIH